jgi:FkbM family methyltransferase
MLDTIVGYVPLRWIQAVSRLRWRYPVLGRIFNVAAERFRNRDSIIRKGVGKGLHFNAGSSNASYLLGSAEPEVQAALAAFVRPRMTVFDVGANVGFLSVIAARLVGDTGHVICYEPLPANASQLTHNVKLNRFSHVTIRREALGRADGEAEFQVSAVGTMGKLASLARGVAEPAGRITIPIRRLDTLVSDGVVPAPSLIKIDVEGAEEDVLLGATEVIRKHRPLLMIELHGTNACIARLLESWDYRAMVLGSDQRVADAPWNAFVLAIPTENTTAKSALENLLRSAPPRR